MTTALVAPLTRTGVSATDVPLRMVRVTVKARLKSNPSTVRTTGVRAVGARFEALTVRALETGAAGVLIAVLVPPPPPPPHPVKDTAVIAPTGNQIGSVAAAPKVILMASQ